MDISYIKCLWIRDSGAYGIEFVKNGKSFKLFTKKQNVY